MRPRKIPVGRIVNAHGIRGDVRVLPGGGDPAPLACFHTFYMDNGKNYVAGSEKADRENPDSGGGVRIEPTAIRIHKGFVLMKFPGVDTCDAALALKGTRLYVDACDIPEGVVLDAELPGMEVYDGETGARLGEVTAVETYPASKVYTVRGEKTYLIPAVKDAFILSVDPEGRRIKIRMWEGLALDGD